MGAPTLTSDTQHAPMTDDPSPSDEPDVEPRSDRATTSSRPRLVDRLREYVIPLRTVDPESVPTDLTPLESLFDETRIVGLGEATHGTREFFQMKHRLVRYLVTEFDTRVLGLEANFSESLALNEYVVNGKGDPKDALERIYFWVWNVKAVLDLVEWLRLFNRERALEDRVRFYGFDSQYTHGAIEELSEFFETADPVFLGSIRDDLETVDDRGISAMQDEQLKTRLEVIDRVVPTLRERLADNHDTYVSSTGRSEWEFAKQHVSIIEQAGAYKRTMLDRQRAGGEALAAQTRSLRLRDRTMAENVEWILAHENADRMAIWAHDAHINRVQHTSRRTGVSATSMGGHLARRFDDDYFALGFAFGHGSFQALSDRSDPGTDGKSYSLGKQTVNGPVAGTIEASIADLGYPLAILDIRAMRGDDTLARWRTRPQLHFSAGATYDSDDPSAYLTEYGYGDAFDGICYIDETTRARPIGRD